MHPNVHCSTISNRRDTDTPQTLDVHWLTGDPIKEGVAPIHNGVSLSYEEERT